MIFNKNNHVISSTVLFIIFTITPCISLAGTVEDNVITEAVKTALATEGDIPANLIEVRTTNNVVRLRGTVDTKLQADKAIEIAYSVNNVVDVTDTKLKVRDDHSVITDSLITTKVKGKIRNLYVNKLITEGYDLHIATANQVVHIFGEVSVSRDIDTITKAVETINHVKSVKTNIRVRS